MKSTILILLSILSSASRSCYSEFIQKSHTKKNVEYAKYNEEHPEFRNLLKDALHSALKHHKMTHDHILSQARKPGGLDMEVAQRMLSQNMQTHIDEWLITDFQSRHPTKENGIISTDSADISTTHNNTSESISNSTKKKMFQMNRHRRESSGVMYMPIGGGSSDPNCPDAVDAAAVSISQLTFLSMALGIFSAVANIANNINNNNNNNNNNDDNNINSNNVNLAANANVGNQINVQLPPGRRRRRRRRNDWRNSKIDANISENLNIRFEENGCVNNCQSSTLVTHGWAAFKITQAPQTWLQHSNSYIGALALSPSCLGKHLCQIMKSKNVEDSWIHSLAGYQIYQSTAKKPHLQLKDYINQVAKVNCGIMFPECNTNNIK